MNSIYLITSARVPSIMMIISDCVYSNVLSKQARMLLWENAVGKNFVPMQSMLYYSIDFQLPYIIDVCTSRKKK